MIEKVIKYKGLTLKTQEFEDQVMVFWEGRSTERDPSVFLMPVFINIMEKNKTIVMDFKNLEYMNSSTVTPLLKVLDRLKNSTGQIRIVYNKDLKWQYLSFSALEIFGTSDHRIRIIGE